ncbi:MAG: magnesium transporter [Candidatus Gracilibacteria bacterium]
MKKIRLKSDSVGAQMTRRVPVVFVQSTLAQVKTLLTKEARHFSSIHDVYVVDEFHKLVGVFPVKALYIHPLLKKVSDISTKKSLISVCPADHQEKVAYLAVRHHLSQVPVVDEKGKFLGAVLSDTILSILNHETHEDILRMAGIHNSHAFSPLFETSLWTSLRHRLPWLILGLLGGLLVAKVIDSFEATLAINLVLASFIPLVVYMGDAVRTQMEALIIRDLAGNHRFVFGRYCRREFLVIFSIALFFGILLGGIGWIFYGQMLALVLGVALFTAILSSIFTGLFVPYFFTKLKLDPADASGPIATILQDTLSVLIYFACAHLFL